MSEIKPPFYWALLDKNVIPDWIIRPAIRRLNRMRLQGEVELTPSEILKRADVHLYKAKKAGRNRVVSS